MLPRENEILEGIEIQIIYPIQDKRLSLVLINNKKRTCNLVYFAVSVDHRVKIKGGIKLDKYLDLEGELNKIVEHEGERSYWS